MNTMKSSLFFVRGLALVLAFLSAGAGSVAAQELNDECTATVLNRYIDVSPDGTFALGNIPVPLGAFRVRVVCDRANGTVDTGSSAFLIGVPNGETDVGPIAFGPARAPIPAQLSLTSPVPILTASANGAQLVTTGILTDGTAIDLTQPDAGTVYLSTNNAVATVDANGFVVAASSGNFMITAFNEGLIATVAMRAELTEDTDGDGIPDDVEQANTVNPGGILLSAQPGVQATASSASYRRSAARVIDGNLSTAWLSRYRDTATSGATPFIEVTLPQPATLAQIRLFGSRERGGRYQAHAGIIQVFDGAGVERFTTGDVRLDGNPNGDLFLPVSLANVQRVRFTVTDDTNPYVGLAELQLLSGGAGGGSGLDFNDASDAALDFDFDGLTNLEEFNLGTNLFNPDTDGDGLLDGAEAGVGANPLLADTDNDGLLDGAEGDPGADADGDGTANVLDPDSDNDGLQDGLEVRLRLDPFATDSDLDGLPDLSEDSDGDRLPNGEELIAGTDPGQPDTDGDGAVDGVEQLAGCDPLVAERTDLTGRLVDDAGNPVAQAAVRAVQRNAAAQTSADGTFVLSGVTACPQALAVVAEARPPSGLERVAVTVSSLTVNGVTTLGDIVLRPFAGPRFPNVRYAAGGEPVAVALADFDNDGNLDAVAADAAGGTVSLFAGTGQGGLVPQGTETVGAEPVAVVARDFDADGRTDIAVVNRGSGDVSVLLGDGQGGFAPAVAYAVGTEPEGLIAADVNADGWLDLVAGSVPDRDVAVLVGRGDGDFEPARVSNAGVPVTDMAAGDFNGDGQLDLFVVGGNARALLGDGTGLFPVSAPTTNTFGGTGVTLVDVNGDGRDDALVTRQNNVSWLVSNGDGSFQTPLPFAAGTMATAVERGDFDGDGLVDLAIANQDSRDVSLLYANGDATRFDQAVSVATGAAATHLAVGDLNGDGTPDLVTASGGDEDALTVTLSAGPRSYDSALRLSAGVRPAGVRSAQLNADGLVDVIVANDTSPGRISTLVANIDGSYSFQGFLTTGTGSGALDVFDSDADGRLDVVSANNFTDNVSVLRGAGDGTLTNLPDRYAAGDAPTDVISVDVNGDGIADVVTTNENDDALGLFVGEADGSLAAIQALTVGTEPVALVAVDFDGNGTIDLVVANRGSDDVSVLLGVGDGTFAPNVRVATGGSGPIDVVGTDLNGDGVADLAVAHAGSNDLAVLFGQGDGTFQAPVRLIAGEAPSAITAADADGDGVVDLVATVAGSAEVSLWPGLGGGAFGDRVRLGASGPPAGLTVADLDGDGIADLAITSRESGDVALLRQARQQAPTRVDPGSVAPTVTITAPADGTTVLAQAALALEAVATDDVAVRAVDFLVDGVVVFTDTSAPYQFKLLPPLAGGTRVIGATATDLAGNVGMASDVNVTVIDNPPPVVALVAPAAGTVLNEGESVTLEATASDNGSVVQVVFNVDGVDAAPQTTPPYVLDLVVPTGNASLEVTVTATDDLGAVGSDTGSFTIQADPLTTVVGQVVDAGGQPVANADVAVLETFTAMTDAGGLFAITDVPTVRGDLAATVSALVGGELVVAVSDTVPPVAGGTTDVGTIILRDDFVFFDPTGDTFGSFAGNGRDIVSVTVDPDFGASPPQVTFTVETVSNISASRLNGFISFDLDQDPDTGSASAIDAFNPDGQTFLGTELEIGYVAGSATDGTPMVVSGRTFALTVGLDRLGDLDFNFAVILFDRFNTTRGDVAPNGTFYALPPGLDSDGDGLPDSVEAQLGLDRFAVDTDGDGIDDGDEDGDSDGLTNLEELDLGTDPQWSDTDEDGLSDGFEVLTIGTNPLLSDTDNGGRSDGTEVLFDGTNPLDGSDDRQVTLLDDGLVGESRMAADSQGNTHVVWRNAFTNDFDYGILYAMLSPTGDVLIAPTLLAESFFQSLVAPDVSVDPFDRVHVVWQEGSESDDGGGGGDGVVAGGSGVVTKVGPPGSRVVYAQLDPSRDDRDGSAADPSVLTTVSPLSVALGGQSTLEGQAFLAEPRLATDARGHAHISWLVVEFVDSGPSSVQIPIPANRSHQDDVPGTKGSSAPEAALYYAQLDPTGTPVGDAGPFFSGAPYAFGLVSDLAVSDAGVHAVLAVQDGDEAAGLLYTLFNGDDGQVLIDATELTAGSVFFEPIYPTMGISAGGQVSMVYEARATEREIVTLRLDPALDDQNGDAAVAGDVLIVAPRLLTFADDVASEHPYAVVDDAGNLYFSYWERESDGYALRVRGSDPTGINLIPRQTVVDGLSVDFGIDAVAGVARSGASVHVTWSAFAGGEGNSLFHFVVHPDNDGDGLSTVEEQALGTDPNNPDTDGDGLLDGFEVAAGFDPLGTDESALDSDGDGLDNLDEQARGTDPRQTDTDGDGLTDGAEVATHGTDPTRLDTDGDGLTDGDEVNVHGTNPLAADSDGDGIPDGVELALGLDPNDPADANADPDGDGLSDGREFALGTDPANPDTDADGLGDGDEVDLYGTDPLVADSDRDFLDDGAEVNVAASQPLIPDSDAGGRRDGLEVRFDGTDPLVAADDRLALALVGSEGEVVFPGSAVAVDAQGATHVVWLEGPQSSFCQEIRYALFGPDGGVRIDATTVTGGGDSCTGARRPSIALDAGGRVHVAYEVESFAGDIEYLQLTPALDDQDGSAATVATIVTVAQLNVSDDRSHADTQVSVAADATGAAHLVWRKSDRQFFSGVGFLDADLIRYAKVAVDGSIARTRTVETLRSLTLNGGARPAVAVDSGGHAHALWAGRAEPGAGSSLGIRYAMLDGATDAVRIAPTVLTNAGAGTGYPSIGIGPSDRAIAVYQGSGGGALETFTLTIDPALDDQNGSAANAVALTVASPSLMTADDGRFSCQPRAAIASDGAIYLSYLEQAPNSTILAEVFMQAIDSSGVPLVPAQPVTSSAREIGNLGVAAPSTGMPAVTVTWEELEDAFVGRTFLRVVHPDDDDDGLANVEELALGTNPAVVDTDGGGRGDGQEVLVDGTDPLDPGDDLP